MSSCAICLRSIKRRERHLACSDCFGKFHYECESYGKKDNCILPDELSCHYVCSCCAFIDGQQYDYNAAIGRLGKAAATGNFYLVLLKWNIFSLEA